MAAMDRTDPVITVIAAIPIMVIDGPIAPIVLIDLIEPIGHIELRVLIVTSALTSAGIKDVGPCVVFAALLRHRLYY